MESLRLPSSSPFCFQWTEVTHHKHTQTQPFWNQFFVAAFRDADDNVVNFVGKCSNNTSERRPKNDASECNTAIKSGARACAKSERCSCSSSIRYYSSSVRTSVCFVLPSQRLSSPCRRARCTDVTTSSWKHMTRFQRGASTSMPLRHGHDPSPIMKR